MKIGKWAWILLTAAPFLTGCSGFWDAPTSSTTTTTTLSSGYFYLLDTATDQIVSYDIASGTLTPVGSPATVPSTPIAMTVAPNGDFLYVSTANGIYVYTISSGVLTLSNSSSAITSDPAVAMQVDTNNEWLVESAGAGTISAIPIVSTSGIVDTARTAQALALTSTTVNQMAFSVNDDYLFLALGTNGSMEIPFTYSSSSAPLATTVTTIGLKGASALSVAVDPSDRLVYIGESDAVSSSGGLRAIALTASTGALSEISGSPIASGGSGPYSILPISTGEYVYVGNWTGSSSAGNITGFAITATSSSYALTKVNSVATGIRPTALAEDSTRDFVLAANAGGSPYLDAYIFDTTTAGELDTVVTSSAYAAASLGATP